MSETIDNKKFTITNRVAISMAIGIITLTFGATKFYDETKYQELVSTQNKERIEMVNENSQKYVEQEVGGLRSDWERNNGEVQLKFEQIQKELDKLNNN